LRQDHTSRPLLGFDQDLKKLHLASIDYDDRLTSLQNSLFTAIFDNFELFLLFILKGPSGHDQAVVDRLRRAKYQD